MIKTGLGASIAVLAVSIAVTGVLHVALSHYRTLPGMAVSDEITSSIPK